jgi:hypothetical protein
MQNELDPPQGASSPRDPEARDYYIQQVAAGHLSVRAPQPLTFLFGVTRRRRILKGGPFVVRRVRDWRGGTEESRLHRL